jgi:antitoxin (DNA-binding transcriptional repressor) of toxin-antitoxin stability system
MWHILWHILFMPSVNLRELRNTRQLKLWLKAGETVELRERNTVLARIFPERAAPSPIEWPDAAARRKRIFGDRVLPVVETITEERGRY